MAIHGRALPGPEGVGAGAANLAGPPGSPATEVLVPAGTAFVFSSLRCSAVFSSTGGAGGAAIFQSLHGALPCADNNLNALLRPAAPPMTFPLVEGAHLALAARTLASNGPPLSASTILMNWA